MYDLIFSNRCFEGFQYSLSNLAVRRSQKKVFVPYCKTNLRKSFVLIRHTMNWNLLDTKPSVFVNAAAFRRFLDESVSESLA